MLVDLVRHAQQLPNYELASWKPEFKGDMELQILANGTWMHEGQAITKSKIMQLFSRLLQRQSNGDYWLITPHEAFRIQVQDLPFTLVSADCVQGVWQLTTNCGDLVQLDQLDQLQVFIDAQGQPQPQLLVRQGLWGRISRSVFYQLALACDSVASAEGQRAILTSAGLTYDFGEL